MNLSESARAVGLSQPTLSRWLKSGLIRPVKRRKGCQGSPVEFSDRNLRELRVMVGLREELPLQSVREAVSFLRRLGHNPTSSGRFFALAGSAKKNRRLIKVVEGINEVIELLSERQGQTLLFVPVGNLVLPGDELEPEEEQQASA